MPDDGVPPKPKTWWAAVWRGLVVDEQATHYHQMGGAIWLFIYLLIHADRKTGVLQRKYATVARDMGVSDHTVRHWLRRLRQHDYVSVISHGRGLVIHIRRWKTYSATSRLSTAARAE